MTVPKDTKVFKTLSARLDPGSMIKPGELIDVVEISPLTLTDRRIYNLLIERAWDEIERPVTHSIAKRDLRGTRDANDRVGDSIERLMAAIARLEIDREGKLFIRRVQLLGATDEGKEEDSILYYRFPQELRAIIRRSQVFARLQKDVIFALSSKYSLALYEVCKKRVNLTHKWSEQICLERFRHMLGVEPGKLNEFKHLNLRAIQPALLEVNALSDLGCSIEPVFTGRKVTGVTLFWWRKNTDEIKTAYRELQAAKVGRRARLKGTVERIILDAAELPSPAPKPRI